MRASSAPSASTSLRRHAIQLAHAVADEGVAAPTLRRDAHPVQHARHMRGERAEVALAAAQRSLGVDALGDLLDRALVEGDRTARVAHHVGVLADPDQLARAMAVDARDEAADTSVALHQPHEFGAAPGLDIPLGGDIAHAGQQLGLAAVAVHAAPAPGWHAPADHRANCGRRRSAGSRTSMLKSAQIAGGRRIGCFRRAAAAAAARGRLQLTRSLGPHASPTDQGARPAASDGNGSTRACRQPPARGAAAR